jgi:hypothetical protein
VIVSSEFMSIATIETAKIGCNAADNESVEMVDLTPDRDEA